MEEKIIEEKNMEEKIIEEKIFEEKNIKEKSTEEENIKAIYIKEKFIQGKIIKGIAGFYYVHVMETDRIYECKAKGIFRKENKKPLVGEAVTMEILDEENRKGNIAALLPRKNELIRPAVANIDQSLIIFSVRKPDPNLNLLDRFLIMMEQQGLTGIICFNKEDMGTEEEKEELRRNYKNCGHQLLFVSARTQTGIEELRGLLKGKTTAVAGPSGVGKSSLINCLHPAAAMETGSISAKIERGRHTTRHSELIALGDGSYIMDTPGFTSLRLFDMEKEELKDYYAEFSVHADSCRFHGCMHISEPGCRVKEALERGEISRLRYENYQQLYRELQEQRRY